MLSSSSVSVRTVEPFPATKTFCMRLRLFLSCSSPVAFRSLFAWDFFFLSSSWTGAEQLRSPVVFVDWERGRGHAAPKVKSQRRWLFELIRPIVLVDWERGCGHAAPTAESRGGGYSRSSLNVGNEDWGSVTITV